MEKSNAWANVAESFFKDRGGMPYTNVRTVMKVLRDKDNLYVRVDSLYPGKHPEDMYGKERDGDIFKEEYVELGIMPPGGKIYRLVANPIDGSLYDSVFAPDGRKRMTEDAKWNGKWEFAYKVSGKKGPWSLPGRIWTAWFKIPFSEFGGKAPEAGEAWGFNAARNRIGQYMLWSDATSVAETNSLGQIIF